MARKPRATATVRTPLTRERVLRAAIALADDDGVEALSMRRLGHELGVEAMSLYNHVASKNDLLDGMVDLVVGEIELPSGDEPWDSAVKTCATSFHATLLRHPWACSLVMSPRGTPTARALSPRLAYMEWLLRRLREAGFSPELTYHAYHAVDAHVLGFTMWQLGHSAAAANLTKEKSLAELAAAFLRDLRGGEYPHLAEHVEQHLAAPADGGAREFEFGLDLILDGLKRARGTA